MVDQAIGKPKAPKAKYIKINKYKKAAKRTADKILLCSSPKERRKKK
jgi:hypothetical protein